MRKAMVISIVCAVILSACGNVSETVERTESTEISAMSQTTTTVTASALTSAKEEMDTSETTTTTSKSLQTVSETSSKAEISKVKTTNKNTVGSLAVSMHTPQEQTQQQSYPQAEQQFQETTQEITTQQKHTTAKPTTTAPPKPTTTTQKPESTVTWSDDMKAWRKLCEGKSLSDDEQNLIRNEILEYAQNFNGKTDIHVSFGIDEYDISYEKPLNLIIRNDMTDLSYAHMDAYVDADRGWQISNAKDEEEIYEIVCETRSDCLHVIDYGLFNRWEIYSGNDVLKYAGDIEFNVGFDGTALWFLTKD